MLDFLQVQRLEFVEKVELYLMVRPFYFQGK